jgi:hypothetical protein
MVLEKVAPPPVCPNDIVVNSDLGECGIVVDFNVSAHYLATIDQTEGIASGLLFPVGVTSQTFEIDLNGNITMCAFSVTVVDVEPPVPVVDPLLDVVEDCEATLIAPTATDNCAGEVTGTTTDPLVYTEQGTSTVTWTYDDGHGNVVTQVQTIVVNDLTPPVIDVIEEPVILWPPSHKYVYFGLDDLVLGVSDNCIDELEIGDVKIVKVTSDEEENAIGLGDGNTVEDMVISEDCSSVGLRSERQGTGNGRVYTIHFELDDGNENTGVAMCSVFVPHDKNDLTMDDGLVYEVFGACSEEGAESKSGIIPGNSSESEGYELTSYPNPFSNSTTIEFTLPVESKVMLKIYNIVGQEFDILVNKKYIPGTYKVQFDGSELPAGQYFYRLSTSDFSVTKKMILKK